LEQILHLLEHKLLHLVSRQQHQRLGKLHLEIKLEEPEYSLMRKHQMLTVLQVVNLLQNLILYQPCLHTKTRVMKN